MNQFEPDENSALRRRIKEMEEEIERLKAQNEKLMYRISRMLFNEKDCENFDASEYTIPWEETLANARKRLKNP